MLAFGHLLACPKSHSRQGNSMLRSARRTSLTILAACLLGGAATGCSSSGNGTDNSAKGPYIWGVATALSGPLQIYGRTVQQGVLAYADAINKSGGIDGHQIKVVSRDTQEDAATTRIQVTQLATSDKATLVFGGVLSTNCQGASTTLARFKVPIICLETPTNILNPPQKYVFLASYEPVTQAEPLVSFAKQVSHKTNPRIAILSDIADTNTELTNKIRSLTGPDGFSIVTSQQVDVTAPEMSAQTTLALAKSPDVIIANTTSPQAQSIVSTLSQQGKASLPVLYTAGDFNFTLTGQIKSPNFYMFTTFKFADPSSTEAGVKKFSDAMRAQLGGTITKEKLNDGSTPVMYIAATGAGAAERACGFPCSGEQLASHLEKVNIDLPGLAQFGYTSRSHVPASQYSVFATQNGQLKLIKTYTS
jgi:branched-chain amino acid transport system substrate-binding protein